MSNTRSTPIVDLSPTAFIAAELAMRNQALSDANAAYTVEYLRTYSHAAALCVWRDVYWAQMAGAR